MFTYPKILQGEVIISMSLKFLFVWKISITYGEQIHTIFMVSYSNLFFYFTLYL